MAPHSLLVAVLLACLCLCPVRVTLCATLRTPIPSSAVPINASADRVRAATPTFRPLHISFSVLSATRTHVTPFLEVCRVLAARGHRITVVHLPHHTRWMGTEEERRQSGFRYVVSDNDGRPWEDTMDDTIGVLLDQGVKGFPEAARLMFEPVYVPSMHTHLRLIADDKPDLMICDALAHSCFDLADKLGIPLVITMPGQLGAFALGDSFDTPNQLTEFGQLWHEQPMWHRFVNTFLVIPYAIWNLGTMENRMNTARAQFDIAPNTTPLDKWAGRDVLFNGNWATDYAGYIPPYLHLIGPIRPTGGQERVGAADIEPHLQHWLDESEQSGIPVLYMSMGSVVWLVERVQQAFLNAFSSCPALPLSSTSNPSLPVPHFRVVWQSNKPLAASTRAAMPDWVREEKWVAQPAILAHPATSLFISHMGAASMQEAVTLGLPMLAVPFFGDQPSNGLRLQDHGAAVKVDHKTVTGDELCRAIRHLVYNESVRANIDRLQQIYHLSTDGASRGADVVERAAYVGTQHLIPYRERKDVSWIIRYNVDVYAIGVGIVAAVVYGVYRLLGALVGAGLAMMGRRPKSKLA